MADKEAAWITDYINRSWHNHWALLGQLITAGEFDIVLSPMALSWLTETEYMRLGALVEDAEWATSLPDRAAALPELPLDLDPFLSFMDKKIGGFFTRQQSFNYFIPR